MAGFQRRVFGRGRSWVTAFGLMAMMAAVPAGIGVSPAAGGVITPVPEFVLSVNSELVMDIPGASTAQGTQLVQWEGHGGANQEWLLLPFGEGGAYVIVSSLTGMVVDVARASTADGAAVVQWPWAGTANQVWFVAPFGADWVFISASSGKVLDVTGASIDNGAPLIQFTWLGGLNQIWHRIT